MGFFRLPVVLTAFAGVCGGLLLTLLSGLFVVKPLVMDAEIIYFGFPFAWFQAGRGGLFYIGPWHCYFVWQSFVADFVMYGLLISGVVWFCFARTKRGS